MRVLVTGSAGFIGRHMIAALKEHDPDVEVAEIDPKSWGTDMRQGIAADWITYDLVIHAAAMVDGREVIEHKAALLGAYNLQLDGALFEWALSAKPGRIVYFSSSAAYPVTLQNGPYAGYRLAERDYSHPGTPDASYGSVKAIGEYLSAEVRKAGVPVTVVRPFSGYGDDQDDCYPFPAMVARAKRADDPFEVWGNGNQVRDFIHVDDICAAVLALVDAEVDGPVNLGTGIGTSVDQLAELCMAEAGYSAPIRHLGTKPVGVQYRVCDPTLMHRYYEPQVTIQEGVRRALVGARV